MGASFGKALLGTSRFVGTTSVNYPSYKTRLGVNFMASEQLNLFLHLNLPIPSYRSLLRTQNRPPQLPRPKQTQIQVTLQKLAPTTDQIESQQRAPWSRQPPGQYRRNLPSHPNRISPTPQVQVNQNLQMLLQEIAPSPPKVDSRIKVQQHTMSWRRQPATPHRQNLLVPSHPNH